MYDAELMLRAGYDEAGDPVDLTADEAANAFVDFGGPDRLALTYDVVVPEIVADADTLDVVIQVSDAVLGDPVEDTFVLPQITGAEAVGVYRIAFKTPHRYRNATLTVTGAAVDFGPVVIGPQLGGEYDQF